MKNISKRFSIKIPSEISVLYCLKTQTLLLKTDSKQKILNLKVKLLILKEKNLIVVTNLPYKKQSNKLKNLFKSLQGTTLSLIKQSFLEISSVTCRKLKLSGIGYKVFEANLSNGVKLLHLKLGNSHSLYYKIPSKILIKITQSSKIFIFGNDFNKVCQIASIIRSCKTPEPYKGKGILYSNEVIKLKEGKKV